MTGNTSNSSKTQKYVALYGGNTFYVMSQINDDYTEDYVALGFPEGSSPEKAFIQFGTQLKDYYPDISNDMRREILENTVLYPVGSVVYPFNLSKDTLSTLLDSLDVTAQTSTVNEESNISIMKPFYLLSPDGFTMSRESEPYTDLESAKTDFENWKKQFENQGYYSSMKHGRINLDDLWQYMIQSELPFAIV